MVTGTGNWPRTHTHIYTNTPSPGSRRWGREGNSTIGNVNLKNAFPRGNSDPVCVCCFVLLTQGWGRWARGKRRCFSTAAATGVGPEFHGFCRFPGCHFRAGLFICFFFFVFEIGHLLVLKSDFILVVRFQIEGGIQDQTPETRVPNAPEVRETKSDLKKRWKKNGKRECDWRWHKKSKK